MSAAVFVALRLLGDAIHVLAHIGRPEGGQLVDVRSPEEFTGERVSTNSTGPFTTSSSVASADFIRASMSFNRCRARASAF
mgnify:CR=1 FL=1